MMGELDQTSKDNIVLEPVPKPRKKRARIASVVVCSLIALGVIIYGAFVDNTKFDYHADNDICVKNVTTCYRREKKRTFPVLFNLGLGLFSIILGTLVDRLCLVAEEWNHIPNRYNNKCEMFKACFSGISWGAVCAVFLIVLVTIAISLLWSNTNFEYKNLLVYVFSGIGVGPLIMHLLNLNTESKVYISTIIEKKQTYIANGLAWSYYFTYLGKVLPDFAQPDNDGSVSVQCEDGTTTHITLDSDKLILLISQDAHTVDDLQRQDNHIKKTKYEICQKNFKFPVYEFKITGKNKVENYVVQYVKEPLETLYEMSRYESIEAVRKSELKYQVQLLYRTLSNILLEDRINRPWSEKCILVPIIAEHDSSLQNGRLVSLITHKVDRIEAMIRKQSNFVNSPNTTEEGDGFMRFMDSHDKKEALNVPQEQVEQHDSSQPAVTSEGLFESSQSTSEPTTSDNRTSKNHPSSVHVKINFNKRNEEGKSGEQEAMLNSSSSTSSCRGKTPYQESSIGPTGYGENHDTEESE